MTKRSANARRAEVGANKLLADHGIAAPPVPVEEICERLGLEIVHEALPHDTSSVLIRQPNGRQVIGVNARHSTRRQRFSVAHELGHALLHVSDASSHGEAVVSRPLEILFRDGVASQGTNKIEVAANSFAAALLMPADLVRSRFRRRLQQDHARRLDDVIAELADEFEVSEQAMRFRLVILELIDPA